MTKAGGQLVFPSVIGDALAANPLALAGVAFAGAISPVLILVAFHGSLLSILLGIPLSGARW